MGMVEAKMIAFAANATGSPYCWGARGWVHWTPLGLVPHHFGEPAYDCSGLISSCLFYAAGIDLRAHWNAQKMWKELPFALPGPLEEFPPAGAVACYGLRDDCTHVMLHLGCGAVIGAVGGDEHTNSPTEARALARERSRPVCVTSYPSHLFRRDFMGWRILPTK